MGPIRRLWKRAVLDGMASIERDSIAATEGRSSAIESKLMIVLVFVSVDLAVLHYYGLSHDLRYVPGFFDMIGLAGLADVTRGALIEGANTRFWSLMFWASACLFLYFVVPALVVKVALRESLADYGLKLRGGLKHKQIYFGMLLVVLPVVVGVSFTERFQHQYPFYKPFDDQLPPGFWQWEAMYALQFFALEFFFRGFMLHGLKRRFGFYAIFVMLIPYSMIHFGKPFPETIAALVAGFALGVLSLRTGSIWLGFLLHVTVALSMDFAALWQLGLL
jgi:membrane protease YdiL (CAAX protease family)